MVHHTRVGTYFWEPVIVSEVGSSASVLTKLGSGSDVMYDQKLRTEKLGRQQGLKGVRGRGLRIRIAFLQISVKVGIKTPKTKF
jgi:hypothetical protein